MLKSLKQVNAYQVCQLLRSATAQELDRLPQDYDPLVYLVDLADAGVVRLPCDPDNVFLIPDRVPIFSDVLRSIKTSYVLGQLFDRYADTGLVVDALLPPKNSLHLVHLASDVEEVTRWLRGANPEHIGLTIKTIDDSYLVIASFLSYVFKTGTS